jgi:hypothetical protein
LLKKKRSKQEKKTNEERKRNVLVMRMEVETILLEDNLISK